MNHVSLGDAIDQARRFLRLAQELDQDTKKEQWIGTSAKSAAVKRASMDLTRALAVMRRAS